MGKFDYLLDDDEKKEPASNSTQSKKINQKPKDLDQYLNKLRTKNKYDPAPQIEQDHYIWKKLLQIAEKQNNTTYNLLHYLRCWECRVKIDRSGKSEPVLKLALEDSKKLLQQYMTDEELAAIGLKESTHEQLTLMQTPGEIGSKRGKNVTRAKNKRKIEEEARKRLLEKEIMPLAKNVQLIFHAMKPLLNRAEKDIGVYYFDLRAFDNYLMNQERMRKQ